MAVKGLDSEKTAGADEVLPEILKALDHTSGKGYARVLEKRVHPTLQKEAWSWNSRLIILPHTAVSEFVGIC